MVKESTFLKGIFVFVRFHGRFLHFEIGVKETDHKMTAFEIDCLLCAQPIELA